MKALALDVGDGWHGWCLGDLDPPPPRIHAAGIVEHQPPRILAAGIVEHDVMLEVLSRATPADSAVPTATIQLNAHRAVILPPVLEEPSYVGEKIYPAGQRGVHQAGQLCGAWHAATTSSAMRTTYPAVSRDLIGRVLPLADLFSSMLEVYPATGGGKRWPQIGTKAKPGPLRALDSREMYPKRWDGKRDHHRAAFLALLAFAYRRRAATGAP